MRQAPALSPKLGRGLLYLRLGNELVARRSALFSVRRYAECHEPNIGARPTESNQNPTDAPDVETTSRWQRLAAIDWADGEQKRFSRMMGTYGVVFGMRPIASLKKTGP